jgi:hypothetical protein
MHSTNLKIRTDANVAAAVALVLVPGIMRPGIFKADPPTDRG